MYEKTDSELSPATVAELVEQSKDRLALHTSRIFAVLMTLQWVGAVATAAIVSPRTWSGTTSSVNVHVWAALILGGIITILPVGLALGYPTRVLTRHVVAAGQMLMSALLIHITGGRIETHFHVFGSLAILTFYRDWRILITAATIVYIDHVVRGLYWPQSVYGVLSATPWRAIEHAWWVSFEVLFLVIAIRKSIREMYQIAERQVKLHSFNSKIEAEVKERTAELSTINKQMETFCYSMSHDLKAPLRGIQSFSQILVDDYGESFNAQAREYMDRIQESATKMNRLLNDLLEYSRVSTAKIVVSAVDVSIATREALRLLSVEIQEEGAVVKIEPSLGLVAGHEATLIQVMLNLIGNAVRYGKPDNIPEVAVRSETRGNRVRISVQDNGIGIAPEYQRKIFGIFERVPTPKTKDSTGIGLAIVSKAIERLGGTVGVISEPGVGSTFWFELPGARAVAGNGDRHSRTASPPEAVVIA